MKWIQLLLAVILCLGVGSLSGQFADTNTEWFLELEKPFFYPPGFLFGLVWTVLYIMMGVSLYLVLQKTKKKEPYVLFGTQLILNFFWSIIFFTWQNILFAIIEIVILWAVLLFTIVNFWKISKNAAYLLIPYLLWVSFATFLTISIYVLN